MKKGFFLFLFCFEMIAIMYSQTQNEFVLTPDQPASNTNIRITDCKENGHPLATVVFYTAIDSVEFETVGNNRIRNQKYEEKLGCYVLCLDGKDEKWRYIQIDIRKKGYRTYQMEAIQIENGDYMAYKLSPKYNIDESPLEKLARITVYGNDNKILVGAEVKNKSTGWVYGSTRTDGTIAINFENKGEMANVIVSHPSYSDTKEIIVQAGVRDYKAYLRNYKPPQNTKPPRPSKLKPEKRTFEMDVIAGESLGLAMDFTWSYFLIGFGFDWILFTPEQTTKSTLVNSGYTGTFTKTVTTNLTGTCINAFLTPGIYFKYFSVSCKVGLLCGTTVNRSAQYEGWGYGLLDGDFDEYWGSYEQRSLSNTTADKEIHLTLTPQVKGYIPLGSKKTTGLSVGLGYSFIPTMDYYSWLSGSVGIHYRF